MSSCWLGPGRVAFRGHCPGCPAWPGAGSGESPRGKGHGAGGGRMTVSPPLPRGQSQESCGPDRPSPARQPPRRGQQHAAGQLLFTTRDFSAAALGLSGLARVESAVRTHPLATLLVAAAVDAVQQMFDQTSRQPGCAGTCRWRGRCLPASGPPPAVDRCGRGRQPGTQAGVPVLCPQGQHGSGGSYCGPGWAGADTAAAGWAAARATWAAATLARPEASAMMAMMSLPR